MNKTTGYLIATLICLAGIIAYFAGNKTDDSVGAAGTGLYNSNPLFSLGLRVGSSNIQAFDASGNLTSGAITATGNITAATGTFSGSVISTAGKVCLYNGASYTTITFSANSATPSYATSTACN